jgi:hypothetical protein
MKLILVGGGLLFPLIFVAGIYSDSPATFIEIIGNVESMYRLFLFAITLWPFFLFVILISAYFFSDITVVADGLLVEFLWLKLHVKWDQLIKTKPILGMNILGLSKRKVVVLLVHGLTPFHRTYGLLYGFSIYPAVVIHPAISDYDLLMQQISLHLDKNST